MSVKPQNEWELRKRIRQHIKQGSMNHAMLLCSLLLGFGLDAYVCMGTRDDNQPWSWVITVGGNDYVTFWESTTGARYRHKNFNGLLNQGEEKPTYPYRTVGCLFNDKYLYATVQPTDEVQYSSFAVKHPLCWKMMFDTPTNCVSEDRLYNGTVPLVPGWSESVYVSAHLEKQLQNLIAGSRKDMDLTTHWDSQFSHLISPVLSSYETEHRTGVCAGMEEFVEVLHKNIPNGFGFCAQSLQLKSIDPRKVFRQCARNSALHEIITSRESDLKLGLRIHTYVYPEDVLSVWLILACKYRISS